MSHALIVLDEAEQELVEAERWYEVQRPGLGGEFRHAVEEAVARLLEAPHSAPRLLSAPEAVGARQIFVKRFPDRIVFIEEGDALWILAFAHQRHRPGYWRDRGQQPP